MGWASSGARGWHLRSVVVSVTLLLGSLPVAAGSAATAPGADHTVLTGQTIFLCGAHRFGTLTIQAGGALAVAGATSAVASTASGPDCPSPEDVGTLTIHADRIVNHGGLGGDGVQAEPFTPPPSSCPTPAYVPATGNSGGSHAGRGGDGAFGTASSTYDVPCPNPLGGGGGLRAGAPGAGSGPGGRGGAAVVLVSNGEFRSDGLITANGERGVDNRSGGCAGFAVTNPFKPTFVPNTGGTAPRGGGAGGSILIAGRSVDLRGGRVRAMGGDGGHSNKYASGAGGGGVVRIMGPLAVDAGWVPDVWPVPGGFYPCSAKEGGRHGGLGQLGEVTVSSTVTPGIALRASAGGVAGTPVTAAATVAGAGPTGSMTFRLFSDGACATEVSRSTSALVGDTATSSEHTPALAGDYRWTATYNGDAVNEPATSACGAVGGTVTITPFQAPPPTQTATGDVAGPLTVGAGQSLLVSEARVTGGVRVGPGGSLTVVNASVSGGITADAPAFLSLCGALVSGPAPGVALRVTGAPVRVRAGDPPAGCDGNRFAGQVAFIGNRAVTFGANIVSHSVAIDGSGPGNTVVKANTIFGTLGCAGNTPAPADAGQPNTAGAKTGQCAVL
jgi:hypothetical protein